MVSDNGGGRTALATRPANGGGLAAPRASALAVMASRLQVDPGKLQESLKQTVFKGASNEELLALVVVANQYNLNPFLKQIYAFPAKGGGIQPVVGVDGWSAIVNAHPDFDGLEFEYQDDPAGQPVSVTCVMHVRGRGFPIKVTEFWRECQRGTEPWKQWPRRMLRHKAFIQCARLAFGLGSFLDEDEARDAARWAEASPVVDVPAAPADPPRSRSAALAGKLAGRQPAQVTTEAAPPAPAPDLDAQAPAPADDPVTDGDQSEPPPVDEEYENWRIVMWEGAEAAGCTRQRFEQVMTTWCKANKWSRASDASPEMRAAFLEALKNRAGRWAFLAPDDGGK